ncbi:DNA helicase [Tanacetum coccineum]
MKIKSRPTKRKSIDDSSMECDEKDISKRPRETFPPSMPDTNKTTVNSGCHQQKCYPINKATGATTGLPIRTVTRCLPTECHLRDTANMQTTRPNANGVDPYNLKTCDILEMVSKNANHQTSQLSKGEPKTLCSHNQDETESSCIMKRILQAPNNDDEDGRRSLRQRQNTHNMQRTYSDCQRKTKCRNPHRNRQYIDPIGTQYLVEESVSVSNRIPPEYNHLGQCTCVCRHCGAMFWECEKVVSASHTSELGYNKCCHGGRIVLRLPPEYPQYIEELYENAHFMDNIRAYNQMFSMTSLGANVDKSINNGKGPYVFRISGQLYHWIGSLCPEEGQLPRKFHPCYMSLQFPLLFVYGEDGYKKDMKLANIPGQCTKANKRMSMNMYYSYQIHDRLNHYNLLLHGGKLFQHYVVTAYCAIEQSRLDYIRQIQDDIRSEYLSGIYDAILRGDRDGSDLGLRNVLTASFTGSPHYMYAHYLDALAICQVHGSPSFFITFTCNTKWPEIKEFMKPFPQLTVADRADIVDRIFEKKVRDYIEFVRDSNTFGSVTAVLYTIEFQKRGLPHCHSLLWISDESKVHEDIDVDRYVCAELPNLMTDPNTYAVIFELMIHGPCGSANPTAACMKDRGGCNCNFPKPYCNKTYINKEGFVHYRRRDTEIQVQRQHVWLDNRYVVPYNTTLCLRYYAHINVEYCGWTMLIKYLFKYISKGTDHVIANIARPLPADPSTSSTPTIQIDEIKNYVEARYIGPHGACWRILDFAIHYRNPHVQTLAVHLENMQQLKFRSKDSLQSIVSDPMKKKTFTEWLEYNKSYTDGRHLTYLNFPSEYTWHTTDKYWQRRRYLNKTSIGRLIYIHLSACDLFYQRMVLCHQKGCTSFADIRTINSNIYPTNKAACQALGLLTSDQEWITAIEEASLFATASELRRKDISMKSCQKCFTTRRKNCPNSYGLSIKNIQLADLLKQTHLIIWDEAPMNDRRCFEALDRSLKDICNRPNTLFGGKSIMLGGDFRQTLPVKKKASKPEILDASITSSYLWPKFKNFSSWLLDIGNGAIGDSNETDPQNTFVVHIPSELCIPDSDTSLPALIEFIYDEKTLQTPTPTNLQKKAIVCPKNEDADTINAEILTLVKHQQHVYLSFDEAVPHGNDGGKTELLYPPEYLTSLNFAGFPPHRLELKVGAPIILLRNLNISGGLCNGTRLIVTQLLSKVIEARIITGTRC